MAQIERQELHCHECNKYVQFNIDIEMDGNHVLKCPNCGHEHCRVVNKGVISDVRWDSRNGPPPNNLPVIPVVYNSITYTTQSTYTVYASSNPGTTNVYLYMSWQSATTSSAC